MEQHEQNALEYNSFLASSPKITVLINKIWKMAKNPTIESDLGQVLDEFLGKLNECDKYLENGIFNMNFAEAALLLQSSADLYGKKVDLLWDIIFDYQKRILLCDELDPDKEQEIEKLEERKRKYKRKRKTKSDESQTAKLVNNFSFGVAENFDYINRVYDQNNLLDEWEKFHIEKQSKDNTSRKPDSNKYSLFLPNNLVYTEDNEYVGRHDQFHSASLVEEIFHLEENKLLQDEHSCVVRMRIDSYVINDFLKERLIPSNKPMDSYVNELNHYITEFIESRKAQMKDCHLSHNALLQVCCKESFVNLERLPSHVLKEKLRRASCVDSLFGDDTLSYVSDNCPSPGNLDNYNNLNTPKDYDTEIRANEDIEVENHMSSDPVAGTLEKRNKSCSQDSAFFEDIDEQLINSINTPVSVAAVSNSPVINKQLCCGGSVVIPKPRLIRQKAFLQKLKDEDEDDDERVKKKPSPRKKRISEKMLRKLSTGVTANLRHFENFCRLQYKSSEGEGQVPAELSESEESDDEDVLGEEEEDEHFEDDGLFNSNLTEDPEISESVSLIVPGLDLTNNTEDDEIPGPSGLTTSTPQNTNLAGKRFMASDLSDADLEREEESRRNVREWRSFILPKLKKMENKSDFDIHEYGWKIIEPSKIGEERLFKNLVAGKRATEVARYFIATLQLANTNNVEISGAVPGQIANDSFRVKTVDKTKYHELLEEYQAPSEESFRERLERAKAMNPKIPLHSTPCLPPPTKKLKLGKLSGKKLSF